MTKAEKQLKELATKIEKELKKELENSSLFKEIGEAVTVQIRKRTRLGYGISKSNSQTRLKPIKDSTKEQRDRYKKNLSSQTTVPRSNLTATGQLLDSIDYKESKDKVTIGFNDQRTTELSGSPSKIGNKKVATEVQKKRPFFGLTNSEINNVKRLIEKRIQELIKRLK